MDDVVKLRCNIKFNFNETNGAEGTADHETLLRPLALFSRGKKLMMRLYRRVRRSVTNQIFGLVSYPFSNTRKNSVIEADILSLLTHLW